MEPIDSSTWEPCPSEVVTFKCTEELTGCIFLIPTGGRLYVLNFVDKKNHRVFDTGLHVYTTGFFAGRDRLFTLGSDPFAPFILNPAGTIEITPQELPDEVLKLFVFACSRGVYKPVVL
ncbi:hypothetical protein FIBSPDRAFT_868263 [Athelia psychrophila]|uniref:Uncharacterized protein n=1 Tax=Athelia psychrophila TaxID=1759441 RepID=A0A166D8U0_9AGAM|nr:hypothetical protein FIBSPDRAFT_868263 [Fibularhizoctonia sp. CBS 109695]